MTDPICARAAALEQGLWDNEVDEGLVDELRRHADECVACATVLSGIAWARHGLSTLKESDVEAPDVDAAWRAVEPEVSRIPSPWLRRGGWLAAAASVVIAVGALFITLGGPLRNMFSNAVGTGSMGQNQAALSAGIYDGGPIEIARLDREQPAVAPARERTIPPPRVVAAEAGDREELQGNGLRPGGEPGPERQEPFHTAFHPSVAGSDEAPARRVDQQVRVERSASVAMEVPDAREAFRTLEGTVAANRGRIVSSRVVQATGGGAVEVVFTARIPSGAFAGFVRSVHDLGRILSEEIRGEDRTDAYEDILGRLEDRDSMLAVLRARLARGDLAADEVRRTSDELERVRRERDRIETARRTMAARTDEATIEVTLREVAPSPGAISMQMDVLRNDMENAIGASLRLISGGLSVLVIGLGAVLPWAALGYGIRAVIRRRTLAW